jgi:2-amino-4-hydroxy-6-hydroxymethyldihydropteridine diphosphokinase
MPRAYIGLGSNLDNPVAQLDRALTALADMPDTTLVSTSSLYRSPAMLMAGAPPQPDYINAVAAIDTRLEPIVLLDALQAIENQQGRERGEQRWMARTLDLDLLLYDQKTIKIARLTVPHPGLVERNFVLYPLHQIAPDLIVPGHGTLAGLLQSCSDNTLTQLSDKHNAV